MTLERRLGAPNAERPGCEFLRSVLWLFVQGGFKRRIIPGYLLRHLHLRKRLNLKTIREVMEAWGVRSSTLRGAIHHRMALQQDTAQEPHKRA